MKKCSVDIDKHARRNQSAEFFLIPLLLGRFQREDY
jgi:hypothetical protein